MGVVLKMVTVVREERRSTELMRLEVMVGLLMKVMVATIIAATEEMAALLKARFPVLREEMAVTLMSVSRCSPQYHRTVAMVVTVVLL
jgi:hypothetical protein